MSDVDPVIAIIEHNISKLQTLHAFKMSGIVHPPRNKQEGRKNADLRSYHQTLRVAVRGFRWLKDNHAEKKFRKETQEWATILYKDGRKRILSTSPFTDIGEGRAYMDVSKAIIDSFKQL